MNIEKGKQLARLWINQRPRPKELDPKVVSNVLMSLGFSPKGKIGSDTAFRWEHECLLNDPTVFRIGLLKVAVGHKKGAKKVVRVDGIKVLIRALQLRLEEENDK